MLSARLIRMIEYHADPLTSSVLNKLVTDPRTPAYQSLSRQQLRARIYDVIRNLAQWLQDRSDKKLKAWYGEMGQQRYREGVPLNEVVRALLVTKYTLLDYARTAGLADSALELYQELELERLVGRFFDQAVWHAVTGYEEAKQDAALPTLHPDSAGRSPAPLR